MTDGLIDWLIDWLVDWLVDWLIELLWSAWSIESVNWSVYLFSYLFTQSAFPVSVHRLFGASIYYNHFRNAQKCDAYLLREQGKLRDCFSVIKSAKINGRFTWCVFKFRPVYRNSCLTTAACFCFLYRNSAELSLRPRRLLVLPTAVFTSSSSVCY